NALWNECALVFDFNNSGVRAVLLGTDGNRGVLAAGHVPGFERALAWQWTLTRLTQPTDFQAVFAASRALMEIVIDAVLLRHELDGPARQEDWEESAKLKHAQGIARFFVGRTAPDDMRQAIAYVQREAARIDARRVTRGWTTKTGLPR